MWITPVERVRQSPALQAATALVLAIAYFLLGRLTFAVSVDYGNVTSVVFVPEGIALACVILFGPRVAWGVFLGQTILSIWSGPSIFGGAAIGLVNSLECWLGAILFVRWRISARFENPRHVALFVGMVFLVLQPISATGGVTALWLVGAVPLDTLPSAFQPLWIHGIQQPLPDAAHIPAAWVHWWIGNSVGQILIAPLFLAWATRGNTRRPATDRDLVGCALAIVGIGLAALLLPVNPLLILGATYPPLVWIGLRRGLRGVTTANVLITPAVIWAGASGNGFLAHLGIADRLAYVGFFVATACIFALLLFAMFEERRLLVARLETLARLDPLVPLANRRHFVERLTVLIDRTTARGSVLAVALLDVDHFKRINDEHGHAVGDSVLIWLAETCRTLVADEDLAARVGGEEFAMVLCDADIAAAERFADRLRVAVAEGEHPGPVPVTVSIGVTELRVGDTLDDFLKRADEALYAAKRSGRNRVVIGR